MANGNPNIAEAGKATRFQPGQSGNPSGPKPGYKHMSTWIQELLNDEEFSTFITDPKEGWKEFKGAPLKAIVQAQLIKAVQGDQKAFDLLGKYGYGTKQEIQHTGDLSVGTPNPELAEKFAEFLKNETKS